MFKKLLAFILCSFLAFSISGVGSYAKAASSTYYMDQYLSISQVAQLSDGRIRVNYQILQSVPTGLSFTIGYEFPSAYRTTSMDCVYSAGTKAGSYVIYLSKPLPCIATLTVRAKMTIMYDTYSETKALYSWFNAPTGVTITYHTITAAEAVGAVIVSNAPGVILTFVPQTRIIKIVGAAVLSWSVFNNLATSLNLSSAMPLPVVGQYLKTYTWYANNKLMERVQVWTNKAAYDHGDYPISDSTATAYTFPK